MTNVNETIPTSLHVSVTPAQAAFFAGEPFTVTITITNALPAATSTNGNGTPVGSNSPLLSTTPTAASSSKTHGRSQSAVVQTRHSHKRSSHSVSHVPIAHPPTSPGIGQIRHASSSSLSLPTSSSKQFLEDTKGIRRKNRIGKGIRDGLITNGDAETAAYKGKERELDGEVVQLRSAVDRKGELPRGVRIDTRFAADSSPRISSPLARDSTVPPSHPHARKHSLADGSSTSSSSLGAGSSSAPTSAVDASPLSSMSNFSASLDSIAESPKIPQGPQYEASPTTTPSQSTAPSPSPYQYVFVPPPVSEQLSPYPYTPNSPHTAPILDALGKQSNGQYTSSQAALGRGYPQQAHTASASTFPHSFDRAGPYDDGSELILYSYVHFSGTLSLSPPMTQEQAWADTTRRMRIRRRVRGGGSMDINAMSPQAANMRPNRHARRNSVSSSLWNLLSPSSPSLPTSPEGPYGFKPGHRVRASTSSPTLPSPSYRGLGFAVEGLNSSMSEDADVDAPMSVFEVPNAMLGVDVRLKPGESKSWTYTVDLPDWLPPTYSGRTIKFSYQLAVGTCRALSGGSNSRVMKVPVRVYNHVSVDRVPSPYDLMRNAEIGRVAKLVDLGAKSRSQARPMPFSPIVPKGSLSTLRAYGDQLLDPPVSPRLILSPGEAEPEREGQITLTGCREAVEILTRLPKRVSYDVQKEGVKVGILTFTKAAWRLGETIQGVVEINEREGRAQVLKLSAYLEAHESLPGVLGTGPSEAKLMRRVYAEDHAAVLSCTLRTTFALDIPSDAAPAFNLRLSDGSSRPNGFANSSYFPATPATNTKGGVEWKVRVCLLVCVAPEHARVRNLRRHGELGEWGSAYRPMPTPLCRRPKPPPALRQTDSASSWAGWFTSAFVSSATYHDGDESASVATTENDSEEEEEEDDGAGWEEMRTEMVECEVPVPVWPGNTAFRAMDVVFDV